jgi:hypothetical protein
MADDYWARIEHLHRKLIEVLGADAANTLMELLRIPGWRPPETAARDGSP